MVIIVSEDRVVACPFQALILVKAMCKEQGTSGKKATGLGLRSVAHLVPLSFVSTNLESGIG